MNKKNKIVTEDIAVLAVHILNVEEILFEENSNFLLEQYQGFLFECTELMRQGDNCRDIMMHNNYICGVFDDRDNNEIKNVKLIAEKISGLVYRINREAGDHYTDKLVLGIGIAAGKAVKISVTNSFQEQRDAWVGKVLNNAYSMAQRSTCDGRRQIFVADTMDNISYAIYI